MKNNNPENKADIDISVETANAIITGRTGYKAFRLPANYNNDYRTLLGSDKQPCPDESLDKNDE